ncbi:MAG: hypothetical protein IJX72_02595 [Clostridia bacterium]|nr:hypothetical protein [Clostridia bacterium]
MPKSPKKNKPTRWAYLDELDGRRPVDDAPIRTHLRKPAPWEILLYVCAALLWGIAVWAAIRQKSGTTGLLLLGISALGLRLFLYERLRRARCKISVLGTVESLTRRRILKNVRYPVIRFEADGQSYRAHGVKPVHPSTVGNEEWIYYNPTAPSDCFVASDSKPTAALLLTVITGVLGVVFLLLDLDIL